MELFQLKEDYEEMKKELTLLWEKDKYSDQIQYLLRDTFASRRMEMKGYVGRPMFKMCANFPVMKNAKYVSISRRQINT